ncbi:MAG: hypothetical protein ACYS76_09620 [Planctomycetota bacterium]
MWPFKKKPIEIPESNETRTVEAVQLWRVEWLSIQSRWDTDGHREYAAFVSRNQAEEFAESLRAAFKLIRQGWATHVVVEEQKY